MTMMDLEDKESLLMPCLFRPRIASKTATEDATTDNTTPPRNADKTPSPHTLLFVAIAD
jgi:hypothetical protein